LLQLNGHAGVVRLLFTVQRWYTDSGAAEAKFDEGIFLGVTGKLVTTKGQGASVAAASN
jgi:hypothetical protein